MKNHFDPRPPKIYAGRVQIENSGAPRTDGRAANQLRPLRFQNHIAPNATGSTLIEWGNTRVICGVTVEESVPRWMKEQNVKGGWITAEYSMLPYSTLERKPRDSSRGKIDGRSQEIQRLIGRAMRAAIDLEKLGATHGLGGLRRAPGRRRHAHGGHHRRLRGACACHPAVDCRRASWRKIPFSTPSPRVSVGIVNGRPLLDLCYTEDVAAAVDMNLVMNSAGEFIELQGTGEEATFTESQLADLLALGKAGIRELLAAQEKALAAA